MLFEKLSNDLIINIIKVYLKSKYVLYYCNLKLINKSFNTNFNIMLKSCVLKKFNIPHELFQHTLSDFNKKQVIQLIQNIKKYKSRSYYYVRSKKYNINFCKMSFYNANEFKPFYIINGEEGELLCEIKRKKQLCMEPMSYIQNLNNFEYIEI